MVSRDKLLLVHVRGQALGQLLSFKGTTVQCLMAANHYTAQNKTDEFLEFHRQVYICLIIRNTQTSGLKCRQQDLLFCSCEKLSLLSLFRGGETDSIFAVNFLKKEKQSVLLFYLPSPYRAVNTLPLGYKNQPVNAVQ